MRTQYVALVRRSSEEYEIREGTGIASPDGFGIFVGKLSLPFVWARITSERNMLGRAGEDCSRVERLYRPNHLGEQTIKGSYLPYNVILSARTVMNQIFSERQGQKPNLKKVIGAIDLSNPQQVMATRGV